MRKLTRKYYLKIRIYVIILLSIVIGFTASVCLDEYGKLIDAYNESMEIWNDYNMRKNLGALVKAEACETPRVEEEASLPSPDVESQIRMIADRENFNDDDLLIRIASCESGLIPDRRSDVAGSSATGIFQILDMHGLSVEERCDVDIATTWAINKIKSGGLSAWNASKHCWSI